MLMQTSAAALAAGAAENPRPDDGRFRRAMPDDFRTFAPGLSTHDLAGHYRTNWRTVRRWLTEAGLVSKGLPYAAPAPDDLRAKALTLHRRGLADHYQVSLSVMDRWLHQSGAKPAKPPLAGRAVGAPVPDGFKLVAHGKTVSFLRHRYGVGEGTVRRWAKLTNVHLLVSQKRYGHPPASLTPTVASDVASQAAHHLRRYHSAVYSCAILDRSERANIPDKGVGRWYVAGKGYLTAAEVVAAAEAKGFDARAWARL